MNPQYIIEKHEHGWLICSPPGRVGVPAETLSEICPLFPKEAFACPGIAHHFNVIGYDKKVVMVISTVSGAAAWEREINDNLKWMKPLERWWLGTDVDKSSAAMFSVFCPQNNRYKYHADDFGEGSTPQDSADFGRCKRLLESVPEWRGRLDEVATAYPNTAWPKIIARWIELEVAEPKRQSEILRECHAP